MLPMIILHTYSSSCHTINSFKKFLSKLLFKYSKIISINKLNKLLTKNFPLKLCMEKTSFQILASQDKFKIKFLDPFEIK